MMNIRKEVTLEELLTAESSFRQAVLSAVLYNDAFWRIESAYLMLSIGMLNVTYSNLRSCLESVIKAHIIENIDSEAIKFLKKGKIEPAKISNFIPKEYNDHILRMKEAFSDWGVHSNLRAVQLGVLFGPNTFEKMVSNIASDRPQELNDSFRDAAKSCIKAMNDVFLMFIWIMLKGTTYRSKK
jgi:hypothetical protein